MLYHYVPLIDKHVIESTNKIDDFVAMFFDNKITLIDDEQRKKLNLPSNYLNDLNTMNEFRYMTYAQIEFI